MMSGMELRSSNPFNELALAQSEWVLSRDFLMDEEVWKDLPGHEGVYQVSSHGRFRNCVTGCIRKLSLGGKGYPCTSITINKKSKTIYIHRVMAAAFLGPRNGLVVNHKDGNATNNHISNIEYISYRENATHGRAAKKQYTGTIYSPRDESWAARVRHNGKSIHLGTFPTGELASAAYQKYLTDNGLANKYARQAPPPTDGAKG